MLTNQTPLFRKLIEKAWKNSDFYRDYYSSHGIREKDLPDLRVRDLPFISKRLLMENFDRVTTDARLKIAELERWLDGVRDPRQLFHNEFVVMHSSGSTGTIGIFAYSLIDWQIMNSLMAGRLPRPENQSRGKTRVAFYRASHGHFAGVATAVQLPPAIYETLIVSLLEPVERVIEQLHRFQPHRLTGYASSIDLLAEQALDGRLRIQPQRIFVSGDLLTTEMEQRIKDAWRAPICNLYGASESLFLAIQDSDDEAMRVMSDLNVLEILNDAHEPVKPGDEGRVFITNLYNHALPILRYQLGDYVTRGHAFEGESIQSIRPGKESDALPIILDNGTPDEISSRALTAFYALRIERAQFICLGSNRIRIDYVSRTGVDDRVRSEFQRLLDLKGASKTAFDVRRVPSIAADPITGKVRMVMPRKDRGRQEPLNLGRQPSEQAANPRRLGSRKSREFKKADIEQSISNRFEQQVEQFSERLAVKTAATSLTYNELNRRANRIAHAILSSRSPAREPVAFVLHQGISAIATMLGILKAGRFYLSLDPSHPAHWLSPILECAEYPLILTDSANLRCAINIGNKGDNIINIDEVDSHRSDHNPGLSVSPDAFAYLYCTSGSTGTPKAVAQTHRHALHQIMTYTNSFALGADDRCTLLHSLTFSASRMDILGPLLNGAAVLPFSAATEGAVIFFRWLRDEEITVLHWIPSAFRHYFGTETGAGTFPNLRLVILGSEPITSREVELYRRHFSTNCTFVNRYGTTETGNICFCSIDKNTELATGAVPVGFPLEDVDVRVLDEDDDEVEQGQVGQIAVVSPYFSGYWRQPELTSASFSADTASPDRTIYHTGDSGYRLPDGGLVHLGRSDSQVKVRGHRVELGQVERVLLEHPRVREAAVVTQDEPPDDVRLIAYFIGSDRDRLTSGTLRSYLQRRLPAYMIPGIFIQLNELPNTPSGKLDRENLPHPSDINLALEDRYVEPRTELEHRLAAMWSEVLDVPRVGIHDSFLDLGGHSLLAGKLIVRISEIGEVAISFRDFFEHPTVARLAALLSRKVPRD